MIVFQKTSQLPEDDRYSVSFKEYLAEIDVCMGGRVAEEISESHILLIFFRGRWFADKRQPWCQSVYGSENVTSGASSDLRRATRTARAMVKVRRLRQPWSY